MNKIRPLILAASVLLAAFLAYGLFTMPSPKDSAYDGFSSERVLRDIQIISREPHSVAHPEARAKVREYLTCRLEEMGGKVSLYQYDSLVGPKNKSVKYTFDAVNILAEFPPVQASEDTTYLIFVAHYDSRYNNPQPKRDTVLSYGAADDGYGVGVTLETLSQLLEMRQDWKQGVKVLFTDAEEVGMMGMTAAWENDRHIFDNVGLMINLEARGTWGPALLFETSEGNSRIMDLYASTSKYKHTYSLTTVVYRFMPNFTDFTIVKDEIPGVNFSTIADVNHYHTDKDNFNNVSSKTIQHYGEQVLPLAAEYLTNSLYADKDYFKAEKDTTNFTIPVIGLFNLSKGMYLVVNIIIFLVFLLLFAMEGIRGRLKFSKVFKTSCIMLCLAIGVLALGELLAYVSAVASGANFKAFGVIQGIPFDNVAMIISIVLLCAVASFIYYSVRRSHIRQTSGSMRASAATSAASKHAYDILYGTLMLMFILSLVLVFALGENLMFLIPLAFTAIAMVLWHLTSFRVWILAAIFLILLHAFSFLFALSMALTIGAFGAVAMLAFLDIMVLIPLADLYMMPARSKK